MKYDKEYLYEKYNATATDDGNGGLETYDNWLERQLISRMEKIDVLESTIIKDKQRGVVIIGSGLDKSALLEHYERIAVLDYMPIHEKEPVNLEKLVVELEELTMNKIIKTDFTPTIDELPQKIKHRKKRPFF
jgi:hypothetical protein